MDCYFQDIELHIINIIGKAQKRLLICVAWFTNETIGTQIIKKKDIDVEIVIDDNEINRKCINIKKLLTENIKITFIKDLNKNYYLMHNKFCVIDNNIVITGSYNWTKNANTNDENISVISDKIIAEHYSHEFRRIKDIDFPNDNIILTEEEIEEITNLIYIGLIKVLKTSIENGQLITGLVINWTDDKILNKIRLINEQARNHLHDKHGTMLAYRALLRTYGVEFRALSTEYEKAEARANFKKEGLDKIDYYLKKQFTFFKIKAIVKLSENYAKLMDNAINDDEKLTKISNIIMFLINERLNLANELDINNI